MARCGHKGAGGGLRAAGVPGWLSWAVGLCSFNPGRQVGTTSRTGQVSASPSCPHTLTGRLLVLRAAPLPEPVWGLPRALCWGHRHSSTQVVGDG